MEINEFKLTLNDNALWLPTYIKTLFSEKVPNQSLSHRINSCILKKENAPFLKRQLLERGLDACLLSISELFDLLMKLNMISFSDISEHSMPKPMLDSLLAWFDAIELESEYTILFKISYEYSVSYFIDENIISIYDIVVDNDINNSLSDFCRYFINLLKNLSDLSSDRNTEKSINAIFKTRIRKG